MKILTIFIFTSLSWQISAQITQLTQPAQLSQIISNTVERALQVEDANDTEFKKNYSYTRTRTWVKRNAAGQIESIDKKIEQENQQLRALLAERAHKKVSIPLQTNQTLKVRNFSLTNITARFNYTLIGQEIINGRLSYVIDFFPKTNLVNKQITDKLINVGAGRIWVDEKEFAVIKGEVHLISPVDLMWGTLGSLKQFSYDFVRQQTPDDHWYSSFSEWHMVIRELITTRIVDYKERKTNVELVTSDSLQSLLHASQN